MTRPLRYGALRAGGGADDGARLMNYEQRVTEIIVMPEGAGLIGEQATRINLVDEGAGEFVIVEQESGSIRIDPEEWPMIRDAIERMMGEARG